MRIVLFLDLDDTIFQTMPKCPPGEAVHPAAFGRDGTPLSYMTGRQRALLDLWLRAASIIPTTARNLDAYRRVDLPFDHGAILDFGGVVLRPDGSLDPTWDAEIRPRVLSLADELASLYRAVQRLAEERDLGVNVRVITDFAMPLYIVAKHPRGDVAKLAILRDEVRRTLPLEAFFVHSNDNNLSIVPAFLGKERAVKHVLECHFASEPILTIGMGDSLTDAGFLHQCDFHLMPRGCQIAQHSFPRSEGP